MHTARTQRLLLATLLLSASVLVSTPAFGQAPAVIERLVTALKGVDRSKSGLELLKIVETRGVVIGASDLELLEVALTRGGEDATALALKSDPALRAVALAATGKTAAGAVTGSACPGPICELGDIGAAIDVAAGTRSLAYYDEVLSHDGTVRPFYERAYRYYMGLSDEAKAAFAKTTRADFQGDNALTPLPRILTRAEFDFIAKGVEQRARVLQEIAKDHFAGTHRYEAVVPRAVMDKIIERNGEAGYAALMEGEVGQNIRFLYGPDISRDANGVWRVIEDNHGYVGGRGDLVRAREIFDERLPELAQVIPATNKPAEFYDGVMERARALKGEGEVVVLARPPFPDNENARMHQLLQDRGAILVTPGRGANSLVVEENGVFVQTGDAKKKVGYVIIDDELVYYTGGHSVVSHRWSGNGVPGLLDAIFAGRVRASQTPGVDFLADKVLTTYMDDLTRLYLNQEPILRDVPAIRFAVVAPDGALGADATALDTVLKNKDRYVLKSVDGRGGYGVTIGPKVSQQTWESTVQRVSSNPAGWIAQEYTHLSVMGDQLVDLRFHSIVDENGVLVSNTPWGRAVGVTGDGKVNISQKGAEATVLIVP